ncbi:MAG: glycosyltransferase [Lysobacterales bacterium]
MRILHVVPTYLPATRYGGPIQSVHGLCKALVQQGHEVHVYTSSLDGAGRLNVPENEPVDLDGVKVWYFRCRWIAVCWLPQMASALRNSVEAFDAVHLHAVFLWPTAKAAQQARRRGTPYVLSPRGMLVPELIASKSAWRKRLWIRWIERRNLRAAGAIHLTSSTEAADLRRCGLDLAPMVEIPNGVDWPISAVRRPRAGELLFLGRLSWKKNLTTLVEALRLIPDARLTLAGPDDEGLWPALQAQSRTSGCGDRLRWVGAVNDSQKAELFARSCALVLPSINENFGNVVVEAMAHGLAVVLTPGVGVRGVVEACRGGLVAGDATASGIASALNSLLADPVAAEEMGQRGSRHVRLHLSWERVAKDMVRVYEKCIAESKVMAGA